MFRTLIVKKIKTFILKELTESNIGNGIQFSIIDFSVSYALQGKSYMESMQNNISYTVLQAALVLTITIPLYINPPVLQSTLNLRIFSFLMGFASFNLLSCVISCYMLSATYNMPFLTVVVVTNYLAIISTIAGALVAGFDRSLFDGWIHIYIVVVLALLLYYAYTGERHAAKLQDEKALAFYQKYCDANGELKDKYLDFIDSPNSDKV